MYYLLNVAVNGMNAWNDYLCFGLLFAMLLSILKAGSYGYYQILFVVMLMVVAGIKSSCGLLVKFIYLYTGGQTPFWRRQSDESK